MLFVTLRYLVLAKFFVSSLALQRHRIPISKCLLERMENARKCILVSKSPERSRLFHGKIIEYHADRFLRSCSEHTVFQKKRMTCALCVLCMEYIFSLAVQWLLSLTPSCRLIRRWKLHYNRVLRHGDR